MCVVPGVGSCPGRESGGCAPLRRSVCPPWWVACPRRRARKDRLTLPGPGTLTPGTCPWRGGVQWNLCWRPVSRLFPEAPGALRCFGRTCVSDCTLPWQWLQSRPAAPGLRPPPLPCRVPEGRSGKRGRTRLRVRTPPARGPESRAGPL